MHQLIVTIGREFGSGGHVAAQKLAERLGIKMYDKNMLDELAERYGYDKDVLLKHDETPTNALFSRKIRGFSSSLEDVIAQREFELIREKAASGESFVLVGRCGEFILRSHPNICRFFVRGDVETKCSRVMQLYGIDREEALDRMKRRDHQRKTFHNYYSDTKWGDTRGYDLCINGDALSVDSLVDILYTFVQLKTK